MRYKGDSYKFISELYSYLKMDGSYKSGNNNKNVEYPITNRHFGVKDFTLSSNKTTYEDWENDNVKSFSNIL